jgi:hypothetical protein
MAELEREYGLPHDTWGAYFGGLILREVSLEEAVGNALLGCWPNRSSGEAGYAILDDKLP